MSEEATGVVGYCDEVKGEDIYGWAWRPDAPDQVVEIELLLDGVEAGSTAANLYRPDLRASGIGHGRYGWRLPLPIARDRETPTRVLVRVVDGDPLVDGEFEHSDAPPPGDFEDAEFAAFVAAVLGRGPGAPPPRARADPPRHFLVHSPSPPEETRLGSPEYSYGFVLKAFAPLLAQLGVVHSLSDPLEQADALYAEHIARGETSVLLSFAPPHRTPLGLRCPVVPVIAWEFPTIPARVWSDDRRHDWRFVLRQTGRAITLSRFAADAVRATMGPAFPVAAIPAPVRDRYPQVRAMEPLEGRLAPTPLAIDGFVFDTRGRAFISGAATPPLPAAPGEEDPAGEALPEEAAVEGVVFTAVFSPKDGRKNWADMVTAFVEAHRANADATFVLKMIGTDPARWWWELHDILGRLPPFACRLVVLHGYLDEPRYNALVAASHWVVSASRAEGLCLPLVEFMSGGRPAISPRHTAMADYVDAEVALVVESDEEYCGWPHDPDNELTTTRHRVSWPSLVAAFAQGRRIVAEEPERYRAMSRAAQARMKAFCSDAVVAAELDSFLGLNLSLAGRGASPSALMAGARVILLEHSTFDEDTIPANLGAPEYSYWFVRKAFRRVLQRFGVVVPTSRPERDVDRIFRSARAHGQDCAFLAFNPPQYVPTDLACPTIPVFAWEFDTIPDETWNANPREDWRYVLSRTGVGVTHSSSSVRAVKRAMGEDYPVWSIPAPVYDAVARRAPIPRPAGPVDLPLDGATAIDVGRIDRSLFTPERAPTDGQRALRLLRRAALDGGRPAAPLRLEGTVYTAVLNPGDGRKNWVDLAAGFVWAFRETPDATLVLKLTQADLVEGVLPVLEHFSKLGPFACRVVILHGMLSDAAYAALVDATHFAVNTSDGEGQCLPLMEFMSAGRPAVAPRHTAMLDYVTPQNAFPVASRTRPAFWPHDERQATRCLRHEISFASLVAALRDSFRVARDDPGRYARMGEAAQNALEGYCGDAVVVGRLAEVFARLGVSHTTLERFEAAGPRIAAAGGRP